MGVPMAQAVTVLCLSLRELAGKEERRCLSAAMGSPTLALQSPLPSPDMLFAGKWGMENEESELQSHRNIPGSQPRHETKHCFLRDFVSWTIPLAFPSMCWIFFKSFVNKSPFCLFFFFFFSASMGQGSESWDLCCSQDVNGHFIWKGAAKAGCVKPHPGCPLICCYMEWKIWKRISG